MELDERRLVFSCIPFWLRVTKRSGTFRSTIFNISRINDLFFLRSLNLIWNIRIFRIFRLKGTWIKRQSFLSFIVCIRFPAIKIHIDFYLIGNFFSISNEIFSDKWILNFFFFEFYCFRLVAGQRVNGAHFHPNLKIRCWSNTRLVFWKIHFFSKVVLVEIPSGVWDSRLLASERISITNRGKIREVRGGNMGMLESFVITVFKWVGFVKRVFFYCWHFLLLLYKLKFYQLFITEIFSQ